jgi:hypothetical protein
MQILFVASDVKTKKSFFVTKRGAKFETVAWRVACAAVDKKLNSI